MSDSVAVALMPDKQTLSIPGVRFTAKALVFDRVPTDETVKEVGHVLQRMGSALRYWQGDHLKAWLTLEMKAVPTAGKTPDEIRQLELLKLGEYAEVSGQNRDTLAEAEAVARFFPTSNARYSKLKFEHHLEAYLGAKGNFMLANSWLDLAERHGWKVAKLRAHIRTECALPAPQGARPDDIDDAAEMELWAARHLRSIERITKAQAEAQLRALNRTAQLIDGLRQVAKGAA